MIYRYESVPPQTALPHLPRRFTRVLQIYEAYFGFYPEIPRLPQIRNTLLCIAMKHKTLIQGSCRQKHAYPICPMFLVVFCG